MKTVGTKEEVKKGLAKHTSGGLKASDIVYNPKTRKYVSKAKSQLARKQNNLGLKVRKGRGIGKLAGLMSRSQRKTGSGFLSDALGSIGLGMKKKRRAVKRKGGYVARGGYVSRGGKRKAPKRRGRKAKGSGAFDDFMTGFTAPIKVASSLAPMARFFL